MPVVIEIEQTVGTEIARQLSNVLGLEGALERAAVHRIENVPVRLVLHRELHDNHRVQEVFRRFRERHGQSALTFHIFNNEQDFVAVAQAAVRREHILLEAAAEGEHALEVPMRIPIYIDAHAVGQRITIRAGAAMMTNEQLANFVQQLSAVAGNFGLRLVLLACNAAQQVMPMPPPTPLAAHVAGRNEHQRRVMDDVDMLLPWSDPRFVTRAGLIGPLLERIRVGQIHGIVIAFLGLVRILPDGAIYIRGAGGAGWLRGRWQVFFGHEIEIFRRRRPPRQGEPDIGPEEERGRIVVMAHEVDVRPADMQREGEAERQLLSAPMVRIENDEAADNVLAQQIRAAGILRNLGAGGITAAAAAAQIAEFWREWS